MAGTEQDISFGGDDALAPSSALPGAGGGTTPPERKVGQRERSSGSDVPVVDEGERCDNIAAAYKNSISTFFKCQAMSDDLQQLDLLMFAQNKLRGFTPLGSMLPAMFNKTRRMPIDLKTRWSLSTRTAQGTKTATFEQLSHVNIVPRFFPFFVTPPLVPRLL